MLDKYKYVVIQFCPMVKGGHMWFKKKKIKLKKEKNEADNYSNELSDDWYIHYGGEEEGYCRSWNVRDVDTDYYMRHGGE